MTIGVVKEIKNNEFRVGLTPDAVSAFVQAGHPVLVEKGAGLGSGFPDEEYVQAGATLEDTAEAVWNKSGMIVKVKEPIECEYRFFRKDLILYTYLHLAADAPLTKALMESGVKAIAYETIVGRSGGLPCLTPMSEIAGRMSVQEGAKYLEKTFGGRGVLLAGVPGVARANVVILGGGNVGTNAAKMAVGLGANVTILDLNAKRLAYLDDIFGGRVQTLLSNSYNIARAVREADLVVGCVLIPGAKAPKLVTEEMVKTMRPGSVLVDVAIDQGGSIATIDRITTHQDPFFVKHGVLHYSVANMPGAVPRTSTLALTGATLPYALRIAKLGAEAACKADPALMKGLNTYKGHLTCRAVAEAQNLTYTDPATLL